MATLRTTKHFSLPGVASRLANASPSNGATLSGTGGPFGGGVGRRRPGRGDGVDVVEHARRLVRGRRRRLPRITTLVSSKVGGLAEGRAGPGAASSGTSGRAEGRLAGATLRRATPRTDIEPRQHGRPRHGGHRRRRRRRGKRRSFRAFSTLTGLTGLAMSFGDEHLRRQLPVEGHHVAGTGRAPASPGSAASGSGGGATGMVPMICAGLSRSRLAGAIMPGASVTA